MAEKYAVELDLPGNTINSEAVQTFISPKEAGLIPRSVRLEISASGKLPDAPSKRLIEASLLLAVIILLIFVEMLIYIYIVLP